MRMTQGKEESLHFQTFFPSLLGDRDVSSVGCHSLPAFPPGAEPGTGGWRSLSAMATRKLRATLVAPQLRGWKPCGLKFFYLLSSFPGPSSVCVQTFLEKLSGKFTT